MEHLDLTQRDLKRYNRQIMLEELGKEGQKQLKSTKVAVLGIGGLGSPIGVYLAAAGFGTIQLIDSDTVEFSNLNRQIIHWEENVDRLKVESAKDKLERLNHDITIKRKATRLDQENIDEILQKTDIVLDAMDNFHTRLLANEYCIKHEIPFVHGAVFGLEGRLTSILPDQSPCLRCMLPETPPEQETFPIVGATAGTIASLEVMEAIKILCDIGQPLSHRLLVFDGKELSFHTVNIKKNPECPVCGGNTE